MANRDDGEKNGARAEALGAMCTKARESHVTPPSTRDAAGACG